MKLEVLAGTIEEYRDAVDAPQDKLDDAHDHPQTVCIICDSEETARLYKVVYNFWFAERKTDRLGDDSWD